jgi:hypothetical protein
MADAGRIRSVVVSSDGWRVACPDVAPESFALFRNGLLEARLSNVALDTLQFSPDAKRTAYIQYGENDQRYVLVDGTRSPAYTHAHSFQFSPDSRRYGFIAKRNGRTVVVVDGKEGPEFDTVEPPLLFSPDSKHLAYVGRINERSFVVVDGSVQGPFDIVEDRSVVFSEDGGHIGYVTGWTGRKVAVIDGQPGPLFESINYLQFSLNGRRVVYVGKRKDKEFVVTDGVVSRAYGMVSVARVSPDGSRVVYVALRDETSYTVTNGVERKTPDREHVNQLYFSPDGKWTASERNAAGSCYMMVGGQKHEPFDYFMSIVAFSPDGRRFAYVGTNREKEGNRDIVVLGHHRWTPADLEEISGWLRFTLDSKHLVYSRLRSVADGLQTVVYVDDVEGPAYDWMLSEHNVQFLNSHTFVVIASRGDRVYRVEVEIVESAKTKKVRVP